MESRNAARSAEHTANIPGGGKRQGRIMPLRYSIMLTILGLLAPLVLAMSLAQYHLVSREMEQAGELLAEISEAGIEAGLRTAENGHTLLQQALEHDLEPAFKTFAAACKASNCQMDSGDLDELQKRLGPGLELYLINAKTGVIKAATLRQDVGLDLSVFPDFWSNLLQVLSPGEVVSGPLSQEALSGELRHYSYLLLQEMPYILEIGMVASEFKRMMQQLDYQAVPPDFERLNPALERMRIFERHGYLNKNPGAGKAEEPALSRILQAIAEKRDLEFTLASGKTVRYLFIDLTRQDGWPIYKVAELTYGSSPMQQPLKELLQTQLGIGALFIILGVLLSLLAASRISRPIKRIIADVDRMAGGDLERNVAVQSRNELRILERSIQAMVQRIRQQLQALRAAEAEITERNIELERTNLELVREVDAREALEQELRGNETTLRAFFDAIAESAFMLDTDGHLVEVNHVACKRLGRSREELIGRNIREFMDWETFERRFEKGHDAVCSKAPVRFVDEGLGRVSDIVCAPIVGAGGEVHHLAYYVADITAKVRADRELQEHMVHFSQLFANSPLAIAIQDMDGRIRKVNGAFEKLFQFTEQEIVGCQWLECIVPVQQASEVQSLRDKRRRGETFSLETSRKRKDGSLVHVYLLSFPIEINGLVEGSYLIYQDISERKHAEEQLLHQSFHDALTGFPNRALLLDRLQQILELTRERSFPLFALLYVDLDRFKAINDSLGPQAGDQLLSMVAKKLRQLVSGKDTVSRLGGDDFALLLTELEAPRQALTLAKRIQEEISAPVQLQQQQVVVSASIGIVVGPVAHDRPEFILRDAEIAMYRAKEMGRKRIKLFQSTMREQAAEVLRLENDLRLAVEREEFVVHYQPLICMRTGRVKSFEALLRWQHPTRGLVFPDEFIAIAEDSGLIVPMGMLALEQACVQVRQWQRAVPGYADLGVSVNLSARQFLQSDLIDRIDSAVESAELPLEHLELEITESVVMENAQSARVMLQRLKFLGVCLSIDDFGTGYSSLAYLQQLPLDTLKIDRSFVTRMDERPQDVEIVRAIVAMAHNLGKEVVAEGVETAVHARELAAMGCDYFQGYYFARPATAQQAEELLSAPPFSW